MIEKKIDIIQKALESNPKNPILVLHLLKNLDKQNKNADFYLFMIKTFKSLDLLSLDINIFRTYLDFKFSNFSSYNQSFMREEIKQLIT